MLSDTGTATQAARLFRQPSRIKSEVSALYLAPGERWSVQAFVKNIENKSDMAAIFIQNGTAYTTVTDPCT